MTMTSTRPAVMAIAFLAGAGALFCNERILSEAHGPFVSTSEALIGRPLTPLSYAGVARRTTRRAFVAGAAVGAARPPVVVVAPRPGCVQVVDAYGRIAWRCY